MIGRRKFLKNTAWAFVGGLFVPGGLTVYSEAEAEMIIRKITSDPCASKTTTDCFGFHAVCPPTNAAGSTAYFNAYTYWGSYTVPNGTNVCVVSMYAYFPNGSYLPGASEWAMGVYNDSGSAPNSRLIITPDLGAVGGTGWTAEQNFSGGTPVQIALSSGNTAWLAIAGKSGGTYGIGYAAGSSVIRRQGSVYLPATAASSAYLSSQDIGLVLKYKY